MLVEAKEKEFMRAPYNDSRVRSDFYQISCKKKICEVNKETNYYETINRVEIVIILSKGINKMNLDMNIIF